MDVDADALWEAAGALRCTNLLGPWEKTAGGAWTRLTPSESWYGPSRGEHAYAWKHEETPAFMDGYDVPMKGWIGISDEMDTTLLVRLDDVLTQIDTAMEAGGWLLAGKVYR